MIAIYDGGWPGKTRAVYLEEILDENTNIIEFKRAEVPYERVWFDIHDDIEVAAYALDVLDIDPDDLDDEYCGAMLSTAFGVLRVLGQSPRVAIAVYRPDTLDEYHRVSYND